MSKSEADDALKRIDILLNRQNVALARSQRLIQSWLPKQQDAGQATAAGAGGEAGQSQEDDEDDFKGMSELAGIGAVVKEGDDEGHIGGALRRKKHSSNDKLLEQLLGKKAASAHRKKQEASRASSVPGNQGQRPSSGMLRQHPRGQQDRDSDEDEEGGRAANFKSKKASHVVKSTSTASEGKDDDTVAVDGDLEVATAPKRKASGTDSQSEEEVKPARKKHSSYLDELLAQKARKKKKKKT